MSLIRSLSHVAFEKQRPGWLTFTHHVPLELDGLNDEERIAFEYHGPQHYRFIPHFHSTPSDFERQKAKDDFRRKACALKGVLLVEIPAAKKSTPEQVRKTVVAAVESACIPLFGVNRLYTEMIRSNFCEFAELANRRVRRFATEGS